MAVKVEIVGLDKLVEGFARLDAETKKAVRAWVKIAAKQVAEVAKEKARQQGFEPPGRSGRGKGNLVRLIKPSVVRGYQGRVRETASRAGGYEYPRIYEYGGGRWSRPFLNPAVEESREYVVHEFEAMVREVMATF